MTSLRQDSRPLYVRASEGLRRMIAERGLQDGDRLPPESELATMLGVSRSTIREALRDLELHRLVERAHGRGTIVRAPRVVTGLNRLESLEALGDAQGWECGTISAEIDSQPLPGEVADALQVPRGTAGVRLSRVKTRDGVPFCEMVTWIPASLMSAQELRASFQRSVIELLLASPSIDLVSARASVSAASASREEADKLQVEEGSPLVVLFETFLDQHERPICWSRNAFVADAISLEVTRHPAMEA